MAKVLKEGTLNKRDAWFCTCNTCGSELRIIQGDPIATDPVIYKCDVGVYRIRYICPVCGQKELAETGPDMYISAKHKAHYKTIIIDQDDLLEIDEWNKVDLTDEDKEWINRRG
ncbi:MAG: hypothetical protein J6Y02_06535 [Pseudobutyrivibrio sp.]|nr:hypothetical protein [Pseudobutyrivibrio sp.]